MTTPVTIAPADRAGAESHHHDHRDVSGGWLRPAVFGAMDGLVTNVSLIAGVGGAGGSHHYIVVTGMAGLVAGAFSMATGEYTSVSTQNDSVAAEIAVEELELRRHGAAELVELADSYVARGVSRDTATAFARELSARPAEALRVHAQQELGVDPDALPSPWAAALSSFVCFAIGALLPLLPYLLGFNSLPAALVIGAAALLTAGALVSRFTRRPIVTSALRQLALGGLAAGVTYLVGMLIGNGVA